MTTLVPKLAAVKACLLLEENLSATARNEEGWYSRRQRQEARLECWAPYLCVSLLLGLRTDTEAVKIFRHGS